MRLFAGRLGMAVICTVALAGCESVPDLGWDDSDHDHADVQTLTMSQTSACRFITDVSATSSYSEEQDMQRAATREIFALAAAKGGNAVLIWSTSLATSAAIDKPTIATMSAKVYACNPGLGDNTQ